MTVVNLGRRMYLHKMGNGYAPRVLITAHGGIQEKGKTFQLPKGVTVRFFTPHGTVLKDPGVTAILQGKDATETITGGACYNYELSKYQGRHGGSEGKPAETYESIGKSMANFREAEEKWQAKANPVVEKATYQGVDSLSGPEKAIWKWLMRSYTDYGQIYKDLCDVITIRNRVLSIGEITLKDAIAAALKVNPKYTTFECSFCRSFM
ncbi:MAG: hypothetical protein U1F36_01750 [Planctomycetota bacterium]